MDIDTLNIPSIVDHLKRTPAASVNLARIYLRASTNDQDATRAHAALERFAEEHSLVVAGVYVENESGALLKRPELFRLLKDSKPGDLVVVEGVDRLSRLSEIDWRSLRQEIETKRTRIVSMDLPTSWSFTNADDFSARVLSAINSMMMDVLAAVSRKDYEDRRRRQAEGIAKAKAQDRYKGRPEDVTRNRAIAQMLRAQVSWSQIQKTVKCSRATVSKVAKRLKVDFAARFVEN